MRKVIDVLSESKRNANELTSVVRKKVNKELAKYNQYFDTIPFKEISKMLDEFELVPVQEDGTLWEGFFTGNSGKALIEVADSRSYNRDTKMFEIVYENTRLYISWYRMQSGRYEIVSYLS